MRHPTLLDMQIIQRATIVDRREGLETHWNCNIIIIYVGQGLCKNKVLHRHVCIAFLPNPPIVILELPNCLSHEWLTFLKRCYLILVS